MTARILPFTAASCHTQPRISCPTCKGPISAREAHSIDNVIDQARDALNARYALWFVSGSVGTAIVIFVLMLSLRGVS